MGSNGRRPLFRGCNGRRKNTSNEQSRDGKIIGAVFELLVPFVTKFWLTNRASTIVQSVKTVRSAALVQAVPGYAAVVSAPQRIDVKREEFRAPAAGEVRVRIEGWGGCASNLELWLGMPWFKYPIEPGAPGHEAWG